MFQRGLPTLLWQNIGIVQVQSYEQESEVHRFGKGKG